MLQVKSSNAWISSWLIQYSVSITKIDGVQLTTFHEVRKLYFQRKSFFSVRDGENVMVQSRDDSGWEVVLAGEEELGSIDISSIVEWHQSVPYVCAARVLRHPWYKRRIVRLERSPKDTQQWASSCAGHLAWRSWSWSTFRKSTERRHICAAWIARLAFPTFCSSISMSHWRVTSVMLEGLAICLRVESSIAEMEVSSCRMAV